MKNCLLILILSGLSSHAFGKSAPKNSSLHTNSRILLPADSNQTLNYLFHSNPLKLTPITAPLLSIEQIAVPDKKYKVLQLKVIGTNTEKAESSVDEND